MKKAIMIGALCLAALALAGCSKEKPAAVVASNAASSTPSATVTATPIPSPSPTVAAPSVASSAVPSVAPSAAPSAVPSVAPSVAPPSVAPPSAAPTIAPDVKQEPVATVKPQESAVSSTAPVTATATPKPTPVETAPAPSPSASVAPSPSATPKPTVAADNTKAEALFKDNCMSCHGAGLEGDFGPNLTKVGARRSKDQIVTQVTSGGTQMPGFEKKLDSAAIETLAAWLAAKK
jgi:mono/diheme cytochrome c family protein